MGQELKRLSQEQNEIEDKLQDLQAQISIAIKYTSRNIDSSTLLSVNSAMMLTECLASFGDITRRLQEGKTTCHPLSERVKKLETMLWFPDERKMNAINLWQGQFEECKQAHWKEAQE